ncbi:MAG: dTDP-4-dehydrorhamnose reductase [Sandaracinaceae bacterium]|nr:dTDP-4-dehydrorhamnose reductase [Sandaracinaceae bacterium]
MGTLRHQRIVILGAGGNLGRAFVHHLAPIAKSLRVYDRSELDLTQKKTLRRLFDERPDLILNCAAYTDVDGAERDEARAFEVNARAPGDLALIASGIGAKLVHFSTDYVFDGEANEPYAVDAPVAPIGAYGRTKAEGERRVRLALPHDHLIVRTSWVYAPWGTNFVSTIRRLLAERPVIRVVSDQRGRPSSALELARRSLQLIESGASGTYHLSDEGEASWYEFALEIAGVVGGRARIEPCRSEEYPTFARRPRFSVLDLSETHALVGKGRHWKEALREAIAPKELALGLPG